MVSVIRYFNSYITVFAVVLLLCAALMPYCASATEYRSEMRYGNIVAGAEFINSGMAQELFHSQTLSASDNEAMAISFQAPGSTAISPTIAQTRSSTITAASTGFFVSNFQFCPVVNIGAAPVGSGLLAMSNPVTMARFSSNSLMYPEMVVEGNLLGGGDLGKMVNTGITLPPVEAGSAYSAIRGLSYQEREKDAGGFSAREKGMPVILSGHTVDFVSTPLQINNTSIVDRLWRNSHQANALNYLYEGDAAYPRWIAPAKNPYELIDCGVGSEAMKNALILTRPGTFLTRAYWTLEKKTGVKEFTPAPS